MNVYIICVCVHTLIYMYVCEIFVHTFITYFVYTFITYFVYTFITYFVYTFITYFVYTFITYTCMYYTNTHMFIYTYFHACTHMCVCIEIFMNSMCVYIYICVCVCMYICMYVCVRVQTLIHLHTPHTHVRSHMHTVTHAYHTARACIY